MYEIFPHTNKRTKMLYGKGTLTDGDTIIIVYNFTYSIFFCSSESKFLSTVSTASWPSKSYINLLRDLRDIRMFDQLNTDDERFFQE